MTIDIYTDIFPNVAVPLYYLLITKGGTAILLIYYTRLLNKE